MLDRRTFRLTRSELERLFLPLASGVGLPVPETKGWVNGFEVDFYWPELGWSSRPTACATTAPRPSRLVTGCATRRTPPPGSRTLRFTHEQVRYEPEHVRPSSAMSRGA